VVKKDVHRGLECYDMTITVYYTHCGANMLYSPFFCFLLKIAEQTRIYHGAFLAVYFGVQDTGYTTGHRIWEGFWYWYVGIEAFDDSPTMIYYSTVLAIQACCFISRNF